MSGNMIKNEFNEVTVKGKFGSALLRENIFFIRLQETFLWLQLHKYVFVFIIISLKRSLYFHVTNDFEICMASIT